METDRFTVTVSKHYAFIGSLGGSEEERKDAEENYHVTIVTRPDGDFEATGEEDALESYADDICIGDRHSVSDIMRTIR